MTSKPQAPSDIDEDPLIAKYVEHTIAPYRDRMPPEDLEVYRARVYLFYETNPVAVALLDEIRRVDREAAIEAGSASPAEADQEVVGKSGERLRSDDDTLEQAAQRKSRGVKKEERWVSVDGARLTAKQWKHVEAALPAARDLARKLLRRCKHHTLGEVETLVEDSLIRRVRHYDPLRGPSLIQFARSGVVLDLIRAAYRRASDPVVAVGLHAMDTHEQAIDAPALDVQIAESATDLDARARALGEGLMAVGFGAYSIKRAARSPEDDLSDHERWQAFLRAAGEKAEPLIDLLYRRGMTWEEAAAELRISVRKAQRLEQEAIERIRSSQALR